MTPLAAADKPSEIFGWPSSPARLFGIAAAFFVVIETILVMAGVLKSRLPIMRDGQIQQVQIAALWLLVAAPFALFLIFDRDARRNLASPGPWVAAATPLGALTA